MRATKFPILLALTAGVLSNLGTVSCAADPLPSWNDGPAKTAILEFVAAVTEEDGQDYVEPSERIATFDKDGTLWVEYPIYTQLLFAFDRVKQLAPRHPKWNAKQPFKALSDADIQMIQYTLAGEGRRLGLFVHHTDPDREYAYDREGHVGKLDQALDQAEAKGWIIVDRKRDWNHIFPDEQ